MGEHLARPAEQVAQLPVDDRLPTPLTQARKRAAQGKNWAPRKVPLQGLDSVCRECGDVSSHGGQLCSECLDMFKVKVQWADIGRQRLTTLRTDGVDPAHGGAAREKRGNKVSLENMKSRQWNQHHAERAAPEIFTDQILPGLQKVTLKVMSEATGLSVDYCSKIRRGLKVPHPRHWASLRDLCDSGGP
jgi:hypothetical protein